MSGRLINFIEPSMHTAFCWRIISERRRRRRDLDADTRARVGQFLFSRRGTEYKYTCSFRIRVFVLRLGQI